MFRKQPHSIRSKVAIITGASSGIGEATALELARGGAIVVLAARRVDRLENLAQRIRLDGGTALPVPTDLKNQAQITHLVQATLEAFGRIDILANIAGWGHYDWMEEQTAESLRDQYEVNVLGLAELTRQVIPVMKAQRSGHIVMMSSYASQISVPPLTIYASTKYAVEGLADGLRRELLPWGIWVTRIHPSGVTGTEFNGKAGQQGGVRYKSLPIGRVSREKVAQVIRNVIERPERAVFVSRLYQPAVILNRTLPAVIDLWAKVWVSRKRRAELKATAGPEQERSTPSRVRAAMPAAMMGAAAGLAFFMLRKGRS